MNSTVHIEEKGSPWFKSLQCETKGLRQNGMCLSAQCAPLWQKSKFMGENSHSAASILNLSVTREWCQQKKWKDAGIKAYKFKSGFQNGLEENIPLPLRACKATLKIRSQGMNKYINMLLVWFLKYVVSKIAI